MAIIPQYSRISHHTIYGATGLSFSVPPSEDFTDGTWASTGTQLALGEIGISEDDNKAYIRIGNNINQFTFGGTSASGTQTLAQTLALGNVTGAYNISISDTQVINSTNGSSYLSLDNGTSSNVYLSNGSAFLNIDNTDYITLLGASGILLRADGANRITVANTGVQVMGSTFSFNNSTLLYGSLVYNIIREVQTTNATTTTLSLIPIASDRTISIDIILQGYDATNNLAYGGKLFATFRNDGGTVTQVSTTNITANSDFSTASSTIDFSGTDIRIRVTGETSKTINWVARFNYQSSN